MPVCQGLGPPAPQAPLRGKHTSVYCYRRHRYRAYKRSTTAELNDMAQSPESLWKKMHGTVPIGVCKGLLLLNYHKVCSSPYDNKNFFSKKETHNMSNGIYFYFFIIIIIFLKTKWCHASFSQWLWTLSHAIFRLCLIFCKRGICVVCNSTEDVVMFVSCGVFVA